MILANVLSTRYEKVSARAEVDSGNPCGSGINPNICDMRGQHTVRQSWSRARQVLASAGALCGAATHPAVALFLAQSLGGFTEKRWLCPVVTRRYAALAWLIVTRRYTVVSA